MVCTVRQPYTAQLRANLVRWRHLVARWEFVADRPSAFDTLLPGLRGLGGEVWLVTPEPPTRRQAWTAHQAGVTGWRWGADAALSHGLPDCLEYRVEAHADPLGPFLVPLADAYAARHEWVEPWWSAGGPIPWRDLDQRCGGRRRLFHHVQDRQPFRCPRLMCPTLAGDAVYCCPFRLVPPLVGPPEAVVPQLAAQARACPDGCYRLQPILAHELAVPYRTLTQPLLDRQWRRCRLADWLWARIAPYLPPPRGMKVGLGCPGARSDRAVFETILFLVLAGLPWRGLQRGRGWVEETVAKKRFRAWLACGAWDAALPFVKAFWPPAKEIDPAQWERIRVRQIHRPSGQWCGRQQQTRRGFRR